jgi:ornithine cyclodeaminase
VKILHQAEIMALYRADEALEFVRAGFVAVARGQVIQPPVQHFDFVARNGDSCIKSACVDGDDLFVVKASSNFYGNPARGLESAQGLNLAFSALTGVPIALLLDNGWLTGMRTALAGRLAAERLVPRRVRCIGIVGTGLQARLQLKVLRDVVDCRDVLVWGKNEAGLRAFRDDVEPLGFRVTACPELETLARSCQVIVTCTPSREPLLKAAWIAEGTHITAVGADGVGKQELEPALVARADLVVVDSVAQCTEFGELQHAWRAGLVRSEDLVELGRILAGTSAGRSDDGQITLADLTGLGVQDVQITKAILSAHAARSEGR